MMDERVARIKRAMESAKGDDLERATRAFKGYSPEQMNKAYAHGGGQTCQQIVNACQRDRADWQAAWDLLVNVLPEIGYGNG